MSLIRSGGITKEPLVSAFGEALVSQESPITQISSEYGLSNVLQAVLGGTVSITDDLFTVSTGTGQVKAYHVNFQHCSAQANQTAHSKPD